VYVQAERDHDTLVKHDRTLTIGRHCTRDVGGDESITVHQNRVTTVVQHDSFTVEGNQDTEVHGAAGQSISIDANQNLSVGRSLQITVGQRVSITCGASSLTMDAAGNISLSGTNIAITAVGPVVVNGKTVELN
jgi:type VI secretion system secreted protein VgrG